MPADELVDSSEEARLLRDHIVVYRIDGALFFGAAQRFLTELTAVTDVRVMILRLSHVQSLDATGAQALGEIVEELESRGITVLLKGVRPNHRRILASRRHPRPLGPRTPPVRQPRRRRGPCPRASGPRRPCDEWQRGRQIIPLSAAGHHHTTGPDRRWRIRPTTRKTDRGQGPDAERRRHRDDAATPGRRRSAVIRVDSPTRYGRRQVPEGRRTGCCRHPTMRGQHRVVRLVATAAVPPNPPLPVTASLPRW